MRGAIATLIFLMIIVVSSCSLCTVDMNEGPQARFDDDSFFAGCLAGLVGGTGASRFTPGMHNFCEETLELTKEELKKEPGVKKEKSIPLDMSNGPFS